jgi:16S rRNA (adenine1518-N6/adenine1519-N6)-dimethyltransferase
VTEPFPDPRTLLRRHGLVAKKSWGQNFLVSERAYRAIVDATVTTDDDWIVEIGAGLGTLTMRLAERISEGKLVAVERDPDMIRVLTAELGNLDNVEIVPANALTYDLAPLARWAGRPIAVCGNLPYQIASQILFRLVEQRACISRAVVMLQREMADRLVASSGTKAYGLLSVLIGAYARIDPVVRVKAGAFVPAPKVDSSVVRLVFEPEGRARVPIRDERWFSDVVHAVFASRRKTLRNTLRARFGDDVAARALTAANIDGGLRGEALPIPLLAELAAHVEDASRA